MKQSNKTIHNVLGRPTVHPFPARMAPGLALEALSELRRPSIVLDPMAGSGTVVAVAKTQGHKSYGFDVDPLAVLMSRVWTRAINAAEIREEAQGVLSAARQFIGDYQGAKAYPSGADEETRLFARYWFDGYARGQLAALADSIKGVEKDSVREVLWCAFSRLIITKQAGASLALDLSHSRPHRAFARAPRKPFNEFEAAIETVIRGCLSRNSKNAGPRATVRLGDVRQLPLETNSVDLVFTSPPYLNAIDYLRCSKFSLVWMGYSIEALRKIRTESIGSEAAGASQYGGMRHEIIANLRLRPPLSPRMHRILERYVDDTIMSLSEIARVIHRRGRVVYVVGENTIRGTYIPTARLIANVARVVNLALISRRARALPMSRRYLPPPTERGGQLDSRMRQEVILTFKAS